MSKQQRYDCKVGDRVLICRRGADEITQWMVADCCLANRHGYELNIRIRRHGEQRVVGLHGEDDEELVIVPPDDEVPQKVRDYLADKPELLAARRVAVADSWVFRLVSRRTLEPLELVMIDQTAGDLSFWARDGSCRRQRAMACSSAWAAGSTISMQKTRA